VNNIKNYDYKLVSFIIFNLALFLLLDFNYKLFVFDFDKLALILSVPVLYFPIYVLNAIIPSDIKFFILYFNKPLHHFAHNIFSRLENKSIKYDNNISINLNLIFEKYYKPKNYRDEDELWYSIYLKHKDDDKIMYQHSQFLLCRDFTAIIIPFSIIFSLFLYFYYHFPMINILHFIICMIIELIIFRNIAIKFNKYFILSVLANETYSIENEKD